MPVRFRLTVKSYTVNIQYCDVKVGSEKRFNVMQHFNTDKHKKSIMRKEKKPTFILIAKSTTVGE